jgi:hypothetical protein
MPADLKICDLCGKPVPLLTALPDEPELKDFPRLAESQRLHACKTCFLKFEETEAA